MKFEYLILPKHDTDPMKQDRLTKAGEQGWELAGVDKFYFYFKQPKKEEVTDEKISRTHRTYDYNIHD